MVEHGDEDEKYEARGHFPEYFFLEEDTTTDTDTEDRRQKTPIPSSFFFFVFCSVPFETNKAID